MSQTKESRSTKGVFFEALLCDGKKNARIVSFDVSHRPALKKAEEERAVVALAKPMSGRVLSALSWNDICISVREMSLGNNVLKTCSSTTVRTQGCCL